MLDELGCDSGAGAGVGGGTGQCLDFNGSACLGGGRWSKQGRMARW